jgi:hypothetical protein
MTSATSRPGLGEESVPPGEEDGIRRITEISVELVDTTRTPVPRGQHPKHHGCVRAEFIVEPDLPPELRHGVLRAPRTYPALIRFSNGRQWDDRKGDIHGMAIKLLGVEGEKVLEDERHATTQDFVMVDSPAFFIRNVADYVPFSEALRQVKRKSPIGTVVFLAKLLFSSDYRFRMLKASLSKTPDSPLRIPYWSTTPYRLGPSAAIKFSAHPVLATAPAPPASDSPEKLREAMAAHLKDREARFDFLVQLQTDPVAMPVEDPTVEWTSPFRKVATLRIPPQTFDTKEQMDFCEHLSFTPWHCLPEHRPLGGINRTRRPVYQAVSRRRHELNGVERREPEPSARAGGAAPG